VANLNFSAVMNLATTAWNTAAVQAKNTFASSAAAIKKEAADLNVSSAKAQASLQRVFSAPDARAAVAAFKMTAQEIGSLQNGAQISAKALSQIGSVGKLALSSLRQELVDAKTQLQSFLNGLQQGTRVNPVFLASARKQLAGFSLEIADASASFNKLQAVLSSALIKAEQTAQKSGRAIYEALNIRTGSSIRAELSAITTQLGQFKANAGVPAAEVKRVTIAASERMAQLKGELQGVSDRAYDVGYNIKRIGLNLAVFAGISGGLSGIYQGLKAIIDTTIQFEGINRQLEFATGSAKQAGIEFEFIRQTAQDLGIDMLGAANGFSKFAAATRGTTMSSQSVRDVFLGVEQAAATMNLTVDETNGIFLALQQIASKGKVFMEELRGQLGERLPAALSIAADSMGVTTIRLNELVKNGLDAEEFLTAFGPALQKVFAGEAAGHAKTLQGRINLLRNEFRNLLLDLSAGGVGDAAKTVFDDLRAAIEKIRDAMGNLNPDVVKAVKTAFEQLYTVVGTSFTTLMAAIGEINILLGSVADAVLSIPNAFLGFKDSTKQVGFLTRTLQGVAIAIGFISDGISTLGIGFSLLTGIAQRALGSIASAISTMTFGKLSKELKETARILKEDSIKSFERAGDKALEFESRGVAAFKKIADEAELSSKAAAEAVVAMAQKGSGSLGVVDDAAKNTASSVAGIGSAADIVKERFQVFTGAGGGAIVNMVNQANAVRDAFEKLAKDSGIQLPAAAFNINQMGFALGVVATKSKDAAAAISLNLVESVSKLNALQLTQFTTAFIGGLEKGGASIKYIQDRLLELAEVAAKAIGFDLDASLKGMSKTFKENEAALNGLVASFGKLRSAGVDTAIMIRDALNGMLDKAKNPTEIKELINLWQTLGSTAGVSGRDMAEGLEKARRKIDDMLPGINSLAEAFRTFGFATRAENVRVANDYRDAFDKMKLSGEATAGQLVSAFKKYAEAAILANHGVASSYLDVQAALLGLRIKVDEKFGDVTISEVGKLGRETKDLGRHFKDAGDAAENAADRAADALERQIKVQQRANDLIQEQIDLENKRLGRDREGFEVDKHGNRVSAGSELGTGIGILNFLRSAGVKDDNAAKNIAQEFLDSKGDVTYMNNPGQVKYGGDTISVAVLKAAQQYVFGHRDAPSSYDGASRGGIASGLPFGVMQPPVAPATGKDAVKSNRLVDIRLSLGEKQVIVSTTTDGEQDLIDMLRTSKRVS